MATPLLDRIAARNPEPKPEPTPIRKPRWIERLEDKDMTGRIYSDGCGPTGQAA